ncbi:MAG: ABC transporter permease [Vicinamibacterales bacterium]
MLSGGGPSYGWRTRALSLLVGGVVWEAVSAIAATPFLPSASATMAALVELARNGLILGSLSISIANLVVGFLAAAFVGVAVGVTMARVRQIEMMVEPILHALLSAPGLIFVPLLFTLFGATRLTQVGSVFVHAVFAITATTVDSLRPKSAALIAMATAFGATDAQIFWSIRWREAHPMLVSGLRIGALLAVKGMINGEMFIAFTGLGALTRTYAARFEADKVMAIVVVISAVALAAGALMDVVSRGWRRTPARSR